MKTGYSKGFNAVGLICLTVQLLVHLFEYVVNDSGIADFCIDTWACILGYVILVVLFIRKDKYGMDFILTVIGALMWVAQFITVFTDFYKEPMTAFVFCAAGFLGVIFVLISLGIDMKAEKFNK